MLGKHFNVGDAWYTTLIHHVPISLASSHQVFLLSSSQHAATKARCVPETCRFHVCFFLLLDLASCSYGCALFLGLIISFRVLLMLILWLCGIASELLSICVPFLWNLIEATRTTGASLRFVLHMLTNMIAIDLFGRLVAILINSCIALSSLLLSSVVYVFFSKSDLFYLISFLCRLTDSSLVVLFRVPPRNVYVHTWNNCVLIFCLR